MAASKIRVIKAKDTLLMDQSALWEESKWGLYKTNCYNQVKLFQYVLGCLKTSVLELKLTQPIFKERGRVIATYVVVFLLRLPPQMDFPLKELNSSVLLSATSRWLKSIMNKIIASKIVMSAYELLYLIRLFI